MSALAYLSGIAQGVGGEYAKQAEDARQFKQQKDLITASAHEKAMQDPTLDFPTWAAHAQAYYKVLGVPDKDAQQLIQHHQQLYNRLQQQGGPGTPSSGAMAPSVPATPEVQALPGTDTQSPGLPPMPTRPVTTGDVQQAQTAKTQLGTPGVPGAQAVAAQGIRSSGVAQTDVLRGQLSALNPDQSDNEDVRSNGSVEPENTPHYTVKQGINNGKVEYIKTPVIPHYQPGIISGEDVLKQYPDSGASPIGWYRRGNYADTKGTVTHATATPSYHQDVIPDTSSPTGWSRVALDPKNVMQPGSQKVPAAAPANYTGRMTQHLEQYIDPVSGQHVEKVVTLQSSPLSWNGKNWVDSSATPTLTTPIPQKSISGTTPQPTASPKKGFIGIYGSPAGTLPDPGSKPLMINGKPISSDLDQAIHYLTGQVASGRIKIADVKGDGNSISQKQIQGLVQQNMSARGLDVNKVTTSQLDTANFAKSLEEKMPNILGLVDKLDQEGKLGVVASRFNEFMTGKVGAGDPEYTALRTDLGLVQTALMKIHTGSRGSTTIMSKFANLINGAQMNPATLKATLNEAEKWIHTYADLVPTGEEAITKQGTGRGGSLHTPIPGTSNKKVWDPATGDFK